ncbi:MAG: 50S ribosomal protein L15 [Myxococcales bacterium]|nr:50S ribosomal protein L15 [Myxococcales bacterium]
MSELSNLKPSEGSTRTRNRVGRGPGSGNGKTSGRGHNGQNSRSGGGVPIGFEGGQMPLYRRLPKHGFKNPFRVEFDIVNLFQIQRFDAGSEIGPEELLAAGLVRRGRKIKLLGSGEIDKKLTLRVHKASKSAAAKIEAAGGNVEVISG